MRRFSFLRPATVVVAALLSVAVAGSGVADSQGDGPLIENGLVRLSFDRASGQLIELADLQSGTNLVDPARGDPDLWRIDFVPGGPDVSIRAASAGSFRYERVRGRGRALRLVWDRFRGAGGNRFRVEATVRLDAGSSVSRWNIVVQNLAGRRIERLRFPRIANIRRQPDERLAVPAWMGELTRDPRAAICDRPGLPRRLEWPYPGALSMQCLALYREGGLGLYLSTDDAAAFRKSFAFWGESDHSIAFEAVHLPDNPQPPQTAYSAPYGTLVGTFSGDWVSAAERYRVWGIAQPWATGSRKNLGLSPDWLASTAFWVWNRGRSEAVLEPARVLQNALGLPVSVFWHWWHGCSYDAGFPEYLPPREGTDTFRRAVARARNDGIHSIVYMNQRLWGMTTPSWAEKGAERFAVKGPDGKVRPEVYNTYTLQPCASMCLGTSFWRDTYAGIAQEVIRDLGVSGIYMDQACSSLLCHDPAHGHPLGGGTFWIGGFRSLSAEIRRRAGAATKVLLAGEGSGEAWLPYLDLMLTLQVSRERYARPGDGWEVIPFFQAVYHDMGITYGNYGSLTIPPYDELWPAEYAPAEPFKLLDQRFSGQFYLEQARSFAWGIQPTLSNFFPSQLEARREEVRFLIQLAKLRYRVLKYLQDGVFLRPPRISVPSVTLEISRLSIYAGRRSRRDAESGKQGADSGDAPGKGATSQVRTVTTAGVVAGAWRARDRGTGIALANILAEPVVVRLDLKPYGIKDHARLFLTDESGRQEILRDPGTPEVSVRLAPRSAALLELP